MIKLIKGDCLEKMKSIPDKSVDLVLVDPPYQTTNLEWDQIIPFEPMWSELKRIRKPNSAIVIFGSEPFSSMLRTSNLKEFKYDWYWKKERITNVMQVKKRAGKIVECISVFYEGQCKYYPQKTIHTGELRKNKVKSATFGELVDGGKLKPREYVDDRTRYPTQLLEFKRNMRNLLHPTEKPVDLLEFLIKSYTQEKDVVLDFTIGSGSCGVAALNTKRSFIGIEKDEKYFELAKNRIYKHYQSLKGVKNG
jgi:DNA modification methylase